MHHNCTRQLTFCVLCTPRFNPRTYYHSISFLLPPKSKRPSSTSIPLKSCYLPQNLTSSITPYLLHQSLHPRNSAFFATMPAHVNNSGRGIRANKKNDKLPQTREVTISKNLTYLLRHGAKEERIVVDEGGWVNVADVVGDLFSFSFFGFFMWSFCGVVAVRVVSRSA